MKQLELTGWTKRLDNHSSEIVSIDMFVEFKVKTSAPRAHCGGDVCSNRTMGGGIPWD